MFGRKRRILRKSIQKEMQMMDRLREQCLEKRLPENECMEIFLRWQEIADLLNKIIPPEPLTLKEIVVRGTMVFVTFFFMTLGVGFYIKQTYFPTPTVTYTSIDGDALEYRYVPEDRITITDSPLVTVSSYTSNYDIVRIEDITGTMIDVIVRDDLTVEMYYTREGESSSRALYRRVFVYDLYNVEDSVEELIFDPGDIMDGHIVLVDDRYWFAYSLLSEDEEQLVVQSFHLDWTPLGEPVIVEKIVQNESGAGISLSLKYIEVEGPEKGETEANGVLKKLVGYYLVTTSVREEGASVFENTQPIVREFDVQFRLVREQVLESKQISLDTHMALHARSENGFYLISNGRNLIKKTDVRKGDELYLLSYDKDWELLRIVQLTNNGSPHDYWPSRVISIDKKDILLYPFQQVQKLPENEGEETGYAENAGKIFVTSVQSISMAVGTIFVGDYSPRVKLSEPLTGGAHGRFALSGKRLFIAHDFITQQDAVDEGGGGDGEYRYLRIGWWDLNY